MKEHVWKDSPTPRRSFLKTAALTAGALAATPLLERATPRAVAAPANDHGELHLPFVPGFGPPPGDMVVDFARQTRNAFADVRWNKASNKVSISYHYENLPYRPTVHRVPGTNPKNPFTPDYPEVVVAAAYQFWIIAVSARLSVFYYDRNTLGLIGNDLANPPADALVLSLPMVTIVPTRLVEPTPVGVLDYTSNLKYDRIIDGAGNGVSAC